MISDVLSETVNKLDHYLSDPDYDDTYTDDVRERSQSNTGYSRRAIATGVRIDLMVNLLLPISTFGQERPP